MTTPTEADRNARIEEIRGRAEKATPGPWECGDGSHGGKDFVYCDNAVGSAVADCNTSPHFISAHQRANNSAFIAHAREDIPYLLAENARQAAELDRIKSALAPFSRCIPNMEGRDDAEITEVTIELSQEETDAAHAAILEKHPQIKFGDGCDQLAVSLDGLKVRHWRALEAFDRSRS